jgi:GTP pyrophosphokinase
VTSKAKTAIKAHLKDNSKVELARLGKLLISDALKFQKIKINDVPLDKWNKCFKELNCADFQDLYIKVGLSEIFVAVVVNKLLQDINNETVNTLTIGQTKGMAINFAHCCYPIPGDEVTGVLTSMRGLVLHRSNCTQLEHIKEKNAQWMEVDWHSDQNEQFEVGISCLVENRSGRLAAIANTVANLGVNIENIEQQSRPDSSRLFHIVVAVTNIIELNNVLDKLNNLPHVISAGRL